VAAAPRVKHGLVIGKFYPPHAGHHFLVRTAAAACERVSVVVMAASRESIPLGQRVAWLQEEHRGEPNVVVAGIADDVRVDYDDPAIWDQHVALMRLALARMDAPPVTAVFTSEPYGAELARRFDATPVCVDPDRRRYPVSGTSVREDPAACWQYLSGSVRSGLAVRIVAIGAESSGTTTISRELAAHFGAAWVPEYGREYTLQKLAKQRTTDMAKLIWTSEDFVCIAREQLASEERAIRAGGPLLVCDTDAFATAIWHERYVGSRSEEVMRIANGVQHSLYLVTDHHGVPFEQDGIRDGEAVREWMSTRFLEELAGTGRRHILLSGGHEDRLSQAIAAIRSEMDRAWSFA
jgi:HTH-type transcriptional repressor of NAD biosynthesis genes